MSGFKDLTGQKFGKLLIIQRDLFNKYNILNKKKKVFWICQCDCGNKTSVESGSLKTGNTKSCGCLVSPNLINKTFGYLKVVKQVVNSHKNKVRTWECLCICGRYKIYKTNDLINRGRTNCGCITREKMRALFKEPVFDVKSNILYGSYKRGAKRRKFDFDLTLVYFRSMIQNDCFYCGAHPSPIEGRTTNEFVYNGIDRIDSKKGYTLDNVVTSCYGCNIAKREISVNEFLGWIKRVYEFNFKS